MKGINGYHGFVLEVDLSKRKSYKRPIPAEYYRDYIGGRGLGMRLLWDDIKKPGLDALSPGNPLYFMPGPFSGFPIPSASRTCVVTKSPCTSPAKSKHSHASTISYSNIGGFFGPEIRFAGYDGIAVKGRASSPVYIVIDDDTVEIRDAGKFWGMGTDELDIALVKELKDRNFRTCYIGPAGEKMVSYACILHTAARAAGRGVGAVMGSKKLKAIAVRGTKMPNVADHKEFLNMLDKSRDKFKGPVDGLLVNYWRKNGTTGGIQGNSEDGLAAVKNYREGTFLKADQIGAEVARKKAWVRDFACYCCQLSCKKSGAIKKGRYATIVHDGPEYETGTMFGSNLLISNFEGLMKALYMGDDLGMDIISAGNVIGFLMEAYEKKYISKAQLDGIDLKWGNVDAVLKMIDKIARRDGIGDLAAKGVKAVSKEIGRDSSKFAIHVKGLEFAAHNVHANPPRGLCYATANRGACHLSGNDATSQNHRAMVDSLGVCLFATDYNVSFVPGLGKSVIADLMTSITGIEWTGKKLLKAGERVFTIEKVFNYREGFRRADDVIPDRFFEEPLTVGDEEGAILNRDEFEGMLKEYYSERGWHASSTQPKRSKLLELGLEFTI